jgi:hypothetical protein
MHLTRVTSLCALALLTAAVNAPAIAQSRFGVSTLKPPFLGKLQANQLIDNQNRVFASVSHYRSAGFAFDYDGRLRWVTNYDDYPSIWAASTSASLSPTKLLNIKYLSVVGISQQGSKMLVEQPISLTDSATRVSVVYDTASRQPVNYVVNGIASANLGSRSPASSVNDQGWAAGSITTTIDAIGRTQTVAARWRPGQAAQLLQMLPDMTGSSAASINAAGEVAGEVAQTLPDGRTISRAAKWRVDGTLQILDTSAEGGSSAKSIADNGTVLVVRFIPRGGSGAGDTSLALHTAGGQVQVLPTTTPDADGYRTHLVGHHSLSPDGDTVVGSLYLFGPNAQQGAQRAFIFKDGVMSDLTAYATARGVKLPSGEHLSAATSVNAQGSITTGYDTADGKFMALKLTAQP